MAINEQQLLVFLIYLVSHYRDQLKIKQGFITFLGINKSTVSKMLLTTVGGKKNVERHTEKHRIIC